MALLIAIGVTVAGLMAGAALLSYRDHTRATAWLLAGGGGGGPGGGGGFGNGERGRRLGPRFGHFVSRSP